MILKPRVIATASAVVLSTAVAAAWPSSHGHGAALPVRTVFTEHELTERIGTATCGIERWPVKTLTDTDAGQVKFSPIHVAKVGYLVSLSPGAGGQRTRGPLETRVYAVTARLAQVKRERDSDYHLVLTSAGNQMIAEMPFAGCDGGARHRKQITGSREALDSALGGPVGSSWRYPNLRVRVVGVLFFDFAHGQTGHAPNYVELHPVLGFRLLR